MNDILVILFTVAVTFLLASAMCERNKSYFVSYLVRDEQGITYGNYTMMKFHEEFSIEEVKSDIRKLNNVSEKATVIIFTIQKVSK